MTDRGPGGEPWARFDDLVAGRALRFAPPRQVVTAHRPSDVVPALRAVEEATSAGAWAFGFVSYEAAPGLDPRLDTREPEPGDPPLVWFGLGDAPRTVPVVEPRAPGALAPYSAEPWQPDWSDEGFRADVERVRRHIAAGDTYLCNLTVRLRSRVQGDLLALYADLALGQRPAHAAYLQTGEHTVLSASPELFVDWAEGRLLTRPMKGTAPRGRTPAEDAARSSALRDSAKERAQNVMVVDLFRNDVGRVAVPGSVTVPALYRPERYETVWQLTSDVVGVPAAGTGLVELLRALFPSPSVTGAPKQRTMQVIREVETSPRGVYCGALGWIAPPSSPTRARLAVGIRTVVVEAATGRAVYGTGAGVSWDSDPDAELAELRAKTAILDAPHEEFALLETLAHVPGLGLRHGERHLDRLGASAAYFGFPWDRDGVRERLRAAVAAAGPARVRLALARSGEVTVEVGPLPPPPDGPVVLAVDPEPVDSSSRWLAHKTTRRRVYAERAARHPEADDVVLVSDRGEVTETTIANLAVRLDGAWWTPPVDAGCLPGVERGQLVESGRLRERRLTPADLLRADGLAVVSSVRGWRPAVLVDPEAVDGSGGRPQADGGPPPPPYPGVP